MRPWPSSTMNLNPAKRFSLSSPNPALHTCPILYQSVSARIPPVKKSSSRPFLSSFIITVSATPARGTRKSRWPSGAYLCGAAISARNSSNWTSGPKP